MTFQFPSDIPEFLSVNGIKKVIAFSGGGMKISDDLDSETQIAIKAGSIALQTTAIEDTLKRLSSYKDHIAILTGGTEWGVPALASRLAKDLGFKTIGIFPRIGANKALETAILDLRVCVDEIMSSKDHLNKFASEWGDESSLFCKTLDAVVVLGGRAGTLVEISHVLKVNERRKKYNRPPKLVIPLVSSGGSAEATSYLPADPFIKKWCMPEGILQNGNQVGEFLEKRLELFHLLDLENYNNLKAVT